jgi:hypothetical protein
MIAPTLTKVVLGKFVDDSTCHLGALWLVLSIMLQIICQITTYPKCFG